MPPTRSNTPRWLALAALCAGALAACGGDDEAAPAVTAEESAAEATAAPTTAAPTTAAPTTAAPTTAAPTTAAADDSSDDEPIVVDSIDDLPAECLAATEEFLTQIEPLVSDFDWTAGTLADFESAMAEIESFGTSFEETGAALGCDRYEFGDEAAEFAAFAEYAQEVAPGTVGFLQFIQQMSATGGEGEPGAITEGPQNCDEALAYLEGKIAEGTKMSELPIAELTIVSQAFNLVSTQCDPAVFTEFAQRPDVSIFLS